VTCFCHESTGSIRKNEAHRARIGIYNLFNFANYDAPGNTLGGTLDGQPGSTNGTNAALRTNRTLFGSGVFAFGSPEALKSGLR